jgi:hypothetical protein
LLGKNIERVRRRLEVCIKMDIREMGCVDGRWMELQYHAKWQASVLAMLNL